MRLIGVEKARLRLTKADRALQRIREETEWNGFSEAWTEFLTACAQIFSAIEQAAKGDPKAEPWFGAKKSQRRNDPLLQYLHQARNADEHGIEPITGIAQGGFMVHNSGDIAVRGFFIDATGVHIKYAPGEHRRVPVDIFPPYAELKPVFDGRSRTWFAPPRQHFGTIIDQPSAYNVANLGFIWFQKMVDEASHLL